MSEREFKLTVIIPSASDDAGLSQEYFNEGNINLLPFLEKSLIEYLVDDLMKAPISDYVDKIYIIVAEAFRDQYERIFEDKREKIQILHQSSYDKKGIWSAISKAPRDINKAQPIFVIYGDTIVRDIVYEGLLKQAQECWESGDARPWGVVAFVEGDIGNAEMPNLVRNRWGYVLVDHIQDDRKITESNIVDIIYKPAYPSLNKDMSSYKPLIETGAMIISDRLRGVFERNKEEDPLGLLSTINAARLSLIRDDLNIHGRIIDYNDWIDINYPWEYLKAIDYLGEYRRYLSVNNTTDRNLKSGYSVLKSKDDLIQWATKHKLWQATGSDLISVPKYGDEKKMEHKYHHEYDERVWHIHPDVNLDGCVTVPDPDPKKGAEVKISLGRGCRISGNCVLRDRTVIRSDAMVINSIICEDVLIDSNALVDHSVILPGATVMTSAAVPYTVVGRGAIIGGGVIITCERQSIHGGRIPAKYYARSSVVKHYERFGAIIGDGAQLGGNCVILPGRKIGRNARIFPGTVVARNVPSDTEVRSYGPK